MKKNPISVLLYPFSLLYSLIVVIRNYLFDFGCISVFESKKIKTISVGNLSVGGTGKTPHVEYLIKRLSNSCKVATLSRGYGRKTKGFICASSTDTISTIGDEPLQYFKKFKNTTITVCESRKQGIEELESFEVCPDIIILDDAYQHRYVKPSLSILLTEYVSPFYNDYVLPLGRLREPKTSYKRADIIIVTKCPTGLSKSQREDIIQKIRPLPGQKVFFSFLEYSQPIAFTFCANKIPHPFNMENSVVFTAIANPTPLYNYLSRKTKITPLKYPDHHNFTQKDLEEIKRTYNAISSSSKVIFTTEKDSMRLDTNNSMLSELPIFYIPIEINFTETDKLAFHNAIENMKI